MKKIEILKRMIREEVRKIRLKENKYVGQECVFMNSNNSPRLKQYNEKIAEVVKFNDYNDTLTIKFPDGKQITEVELTSVRFVSSKKESRLKEDSFDNEVEELAIQLIDYLGTELPVAGWKTNSRIVSWFKENGIKINTPIAQDIYRKALELNRDNESKSRKYLDN